jgi:hypothetical protein
MRAPTIQRSASTFALALVIAAVTASGCGPGSATPRETVKEQAPSRPKPYRARVSECLEGVAYRLSRAGNALRVSTPGGRDIGNVLTFKSVREAERFNAEVEVDHAAGGRGVAVFFVTARDVDKRVVTDCLTP